jgi:ferric-dicitrate binding protein FerR (iron transport regulator)
MRLQDERLERAIERVLERQPEVEVPVEFAARVRAKLPAVPPVRRRMSAGRLAGTVGLMVLVVALCWLGAGTVPSFGSLRFDLELAVLVELAAVAAWMGRDSGARG